MLDSTRRNPEPAGRRERIFNIPPAIVVVLAILLVVHIVRLTVPDDWDNQILLRLAFVPGTYTYAFDPNPVIDGLRTLLDQGDAGLQEARLSRYILTSVGFQPWTMLTYGLLHADWTHIGLNGLWLLAFGSPVARRLGSRRFFAFLGGATIAGAIAHYVTHPIGLLPVIGASAAVSGCMGAALRFMFRPETPVSAILGLDERGRAEAFHQPLQPLLGLLRDRRAMAFLVVWFLANALFGFGIVALGASDTSIAWQAHMGGFLLGLLALPIFDRKSASLPAPKTEPSSDGPPPMADDGAP